MESAYVDELKASINLLMANLESLPVTKGSNAESKYSLQKFKKYSKYVHKCFSALSTYIITSFFLAYLITCFRARFTNVDQISVQLNQVQR